LFDVDRVVIRSFLVRHIPEAHTNAWRVIVMDAKRGASRRCVDRSFLVLSGA